MILLLPLSKKKTVVSFLQDITNTKVESSCLTVMFEEFYYITDYKQIFIK